MKKKYSMQMIALAGICFLLHILVPHHHHADMASLIEHQHIIEHAAGLHDDGTEDKDHHHHENLLDEVTLSLDNTSRIALDTLISTHDLMKLLLDNALAGSFITVSETYISCTNDTEWNYKNPYSPSSVQLSLGLRGPPQLVV